MMETAKLRYDVDTAIGAANFVRRRLEWMQKAIDSEELSDGEAYVLVEALEPMPGRMLDILNSCVIEPLQKILATLPAKEERAEEAPA